MTKLFLEWVQRRREWHKETWARGGFADPNLDTMAVQMAAAQGYCNALDDIANITFDDIEEKDKDE